MFAFADFCHIYRFQLFFEDSVRNIQAGKRVGLDTVLVSKTIEGVFVFLVLKSDCNAGCQVLLIVCCFLFVANLLH